MNGAEAGLIRSEGLALLVAFAIHFVANDVVKVVPPVDPTLSELRDYLEAERDSWALGARNAVRGRSRSCSVLLRAHS